MKKRGLTKFNKTLQIPQHPHFPVSDVHYFDMSCLRDGGWEFEDRDVAGVGGVHAWARGKGKWDASSRLWRNIQRGIVITDKVLLRRNSAYCDMRR